MPTTPPKISVFTPSHDPKYLDECYTSLLEQTFEDWEWVVLLNGGATWEGSPEDRRVRCISLYNTTPFPIGELKLSAVSECEGELLVEFDHDDLLTPDCLEKLWDAYWNTAGWGTTGTVSMIYSDCAQITAEGGPELSTFDMRHGWEYHGTTIGDKSLLGLHAMEPTPHNVSYIWYAPNHVRAFPRWAYDRAGGYNPDLEVLDDQDLMSRLYQVGPFVHIDEVLYLQRVHDGNTQRDPAKNAKIQAETVRLYDQNIEANALTWARRNDLGAFDLGGAHNSPSGYLSVDMRGDPDIRNDAITFLRAQPGNSAGVIRAVDFLEHVNEKVWLMNLIHNALAPGGMLLSCTPSTDGRGAFQDPTHVSFWNENSFWYYTDPELAKYVPEITAKFQVSRLVTYFPSDWHREHDISYVQANLIAIKEGGVRNGGILHW